MARVIFFENDVKRVVTYRHLEGLIATASLLDGRMKFSTFECGWFVCGRAWLRFGCVR
ncbi:hypothetical protein PDIG_85120 [Penicillium digitatum PHI26]|uniref:Uncharacterized protein n=2 Tax=Penicillium digitatum TaxID=36651 RepID=K9FVF6_PEND2|nr:hypothetical protein PDIP_22780 [Penicillium digitatum Pd1]EKV05056.1 hypothetical protein PDIG_85120 [Penicillium digitatum PHI26]EKV19616.1 hypothetical protein PDIP_22780 [Penicillium digitatum Pd1]